MNLEKTEYQQYYLQETEQTIIYKYTWSLHADGTTNALMYEEITGFYYGEPCEALFEEYKESGVKATFTL